VATTLVLVMVVSVSGVAEPSSVTVVKPAEPRLVPVIVTEVIAAFGITSVMNGGGPLAAIAVGAKGDATVTTRTKASAALRKTDKRTRRKRNG
jgi:hypothetical protein